MSDIYQQRDRPRAAGPERPTPRQRWRALRRRLAVRAGLLLALLLVAGLAHLTLRARRRAAAAAESVPQAPGRLHALEWRFPDARPDAPAREEFEQVRQAYEDLHAGRTAAAQRTLRAVLERRPDYDPALRLLGLLYLQAGRPRDALAVFTRALRTPATRAETLNNLATALLREGQLDAAEARLLEAVALETNHPAANLNLALVYLTRKRYAEAAPRLEAARAALPNHAGLLNNLAVCRMQMGRPAEARALLLAALTNAPPAAPALFNVAMTYALETNAPEALAWIGRARTNCTAAEACAALADPDFAAVKGDPRFVALVASLRAGLEAAAPAAEPQARKLMDWRTAVESSR